MKLVVQRVKEASVTIENQVHSSIKRGLLIFLGVHKEDSADKIPWLLNKLIHLRIFSDAQDKMNLSLKEIEGEALVVSQFTLYADCKNGRRPDFMQSAGGKLAETLYLTFVDALKKEIKSVQTGQFGEKMDINLINEGPVTIILEN